MIENKVPKDIRVYETKVVGGFTFRNIICLTIAAALDFILVKTLVIPYNLPKEVIVYGAILLNSPILAFGYIKILGMPLEKYLKNVFFRFFFMPSKILYKCKIYKKEDKIYTDKELKKREKQQKELENKNPELIRIP